MGIRLTFIAEVAQQSKQRRKDDFLLAFSPVIAEATASAYQGATNEIQQKLKRVVQVWRERNVFELPIQEAIEARVAGMLLFEVKRFEVRRLELTDLRTGQESIR